MIRTFVTAALPLTLRLCLVAGVAISAALPAAAALPQSWNGYKWGRTGNLAITLGDNLTGAWKPLLAPAATAWSADPIIDLKLAAGRSTAACAPVFGGVQVCNSNYGANGWLGYANVWLSGGYIIQATVKLNDYYFAQAKYNTAAWRQMTICQEIGHTLGLDHANVVRTNANLGTCMDYTNDPTGTLGSNGTLANLAPSNSDFAALAGIYATPGGSQLSSTRPQFLAGEGYSIDGSHVDSFMAVPEPGTWGLLLAGFGGIGAAMRRRRRTPGAVAA